MFQRTRMRLTLVFGCVLALILILVTLAYYFFLQETIQRNERSEMANILEKTSRQWEHRLEEGLKDHRDGKRESRGIDWQYLQSNELVVIKASDNRLYVSSTAYAAMSERMVQWARAGQSVNQQRLEIQDGEQKQHFLVGSAAMNAGGTAWAAIDISSDIMLLSQMKWVLLVFSVVLLSIASAGGYWFAGRAMGPIKDSYLKQVEFTANASHELRTPLSVMHSSVELLQDYKSSLPAFEQHILDGLKDEVQRMTRLVESLLLLARSDSQSWTFQREQVNLCNLCADAVQSMQTVAQKQGIQLRIGESPSGSGDAYVMGDEDQLHRLIYILLDNAIKYTSPEGEVTVSCIPHGDNELMLRVSDTGIGIPEDELHLIFDRFYRVDKARSRESGGAGLGLSIASEIMRMHRAAVRVTSKEGEGSCFEVMFHRSQA
ncbi:sensor histidine kinase [Paenibacillus sp. OAS669]|uniref:sensor histidine kinase n=1 Tax=Paenibacillus sp. OAS669 TaxID=2663821 RepID=UPI00178A9AA9|nr:ATP-binding protein [Paenibacillus sp. OAS669]MBE1447372.1 signal transduction histidine kinase [Paenibacillus sp. OAS669]